MRTHVKIVSSKNLAFYRKKEHFIYFFQLLYVKNSLLIWLIRIFTIQNKLIMKTKILIVLLSFSIISCTSSKETLKETAVKTKNSGRSLQQESLKDIANLKINTKINTIIQNYLKVPISSIARSDLKETHDGYQWKFMNVKTGENYIANSDFNFKSVRITKNKRS